MGEVKQWDVSGSQKCNGGVPSDIAVRCVRTFVQLRTEGTFVQETCIGFPPSSLFLMRRTAHDVIKR
jgi:hypothetical protein